MTDNSEESKRGAEILNISVDIGYGQTGTLRIFEHDDLPLTVRNFFIQNNITNVSESAVLHKVHEFMDDLIKEHKAITSLIGKMPNCATSQYKNPGERMYKESMQSKELKLVNHHMLRVQTAKNLQKTLKAKPEINQNSIKLASNLTSRASSIYKYQTPTTNSQSDFTFTPKLNLKSQRLARNSINSSNRIEDLYKDAEVRRSRQASMCSTSRDFPFKTDSITSPNSKPVSPLKRIAEPPKVVDRLIRSLKDKEENLEALRKHLHINLDPVTGQKYFKPVILRGPEGQREENVWQDLYKHKKQASDGNIEFPYAPVELDAGKKTQEIVERKRIEKFQEIFNKLKPDSFGRLHSASITCKELGPELVRVLDPLLVEIQEAKSFVTFKEFCDSMGNLLKILTPVEKDVIFLKRKKEEVKVLHQKSRSTADFNNLFVRQIERDNKQKQRMELEKDKVRMEEIKGCTFKPKILKYIVKKKF